MLQIARWFCCLLTRFCCRSLFVGSGPTPPKLTDWGYSIWGYYVFAMIIPLAYLMNLYTILVLVLSRYHGQRMLKMDQRDLDRLLTCTVEREAERVIAMSKVQSQKRYLQYMASTATSRHLAVLSFISSLPLLLLSLAAKQYDTLPEVVAIPTSIVLFVGNGNPLDGCYLRRQRGQGVLGDTKAQSIGGEQDSDPIQTGRGGRVACESGVHRFIDASAGASSSCSGSERVEAYASWVLRAETLTPDCKTLIGLRRCLTTRGPCEMSRRKRSLWARCAPLKRIVQLVSAARSHRYRRSFR